MPLKNTYISGNLIPLSLARFLYAKHASRILSVPPDVTFTSINVNLDSEIRIIKIHSTTESSSYSEKGGLMQMPHVSCMPVQPRQTNMGKTFLLFGHFPVCLIIKPLLTNPFTTLRKRPFHNILGKGENASSQHFLLFPICFQLFCRQISIFESQILPSANAFNLD